MDTLSSLVLAALMAITPPILAKNPGAGLRAPVVQTAPSTAHERDSYGRIKAADTQRLSQFLVQTSDRYAGK
ncbi:MAG: hypothetical protein AAF761_03655 [Pseudomonadota bacterium]